MTVSTYQAIKDSLLRLYLDDPRPWLVGYSGGKHPVFTTKSRPEPTRISSFIPHPSGFSDACPIQIDTSTPSCGHSRFDLKRQNLNREWTRMNANAGSTECHSEPVEESLPLAA